MTRRPIRFSFEGHQITVNRDGESIMFSVDGRRPIFLGYATAELTRGDVRRRVEQRLRDFPAHLSPPKPQAKQRPSIRKGRG